MSKEPFTEKLNSKNFDEIKGKFRHKFLNRTILLFLLLILLLALVVLANQQNIISIPQAVIDYLSLALTILMSYALASIVARLTVNRIMYLFGDAFEPEQRILLSKAYIALLYTIATIYVFVIIGIQVQDIAIFLGLIATGFAFAIRDVILSYISWFILLTKKPFKIGDHIHIEGIEGMVKHIGMFYVLLDDSPETYDDFYKVPNKLFLEKPIRNYGRGQFATEFDLYLTKTPVNTSGISLDLSTLAEELNTEIGKTFSSRIDLRLDSDKEGMKIRVYYRSCYADRDIIKDKILAILYRSLQKSSGTGDSDTRGTNC